MRQAAPSFIASPVDRTQDQGWHVASFRLLWLVAFCVPWGDMVLLPGEIQASRVLTIVAAFTWILAVWSGKRFRTVTATQLFMLAFVVWAGANTFWSEDSWRSVRRMLSYSQLFLDAWLVYQLVRTADEYRSIMQAYVLGCYVLFAGLMYNFISGVAQGDGRYTAPGLDPNDLASTLALGIPLAWYLAFTSRKGLWLNRLYIPCALTAALLTASRGGLVTVVISMGFPLLAMPSISRRAKIALVVMVTICAGSVVYFWSDISVGRLSTILDQLSARDMNGRVEIWQRGFEVFLDNPLLGVGAGAFGATVVGGVGAELAAHNSYLGVLVEHGLIGLVCFLLIAFSLIRQTWWSPPLERRLWFVMLLAWGVTLSTLSWENREVTWLIWGMCSVQRYRQAAPVRRFRTHSIRPAYA